MNRASGTGGQTGRGQGQLLPPGKGPGPDWPVWVRPWPYLVSRLQSAGGPADPHTVTVCLLGVLARGAGLQAPKAL